MSIIDDLKTLRGEGRTAPPTDDLVSEPCPLLWELLTADRYKDGSPRILPEISISRVPGGYEATLRDHEMWMQVSAFVGRLADLPVALEAVLRDPTRPWRPFQSYRNKKGPQLEQEKPVAKGKKKK